MKNRLIIAAIAATLSLSTQVRAEDMVFTSWGGTTQDVQKAAWADKFTETSGVAVLQDGPTDYGKIKAMVEAAGVTWDVVDVEGDYAVQAGKAGLLEKLDFFRHRQKQARSALRYRLLGRQLLLFLLDRLQQGRCLGLPEKLGRCVRHRKIPR